MEIKLVGITQVYPVKTGGKAGLNTVIDNINLSFSGPGINVIMGPSGCGKSTLMRMIGGVRPQAVPTPSKGQIVVNGVEVHDQLDEPLAKSESLRMAWAQSALVTVGAEAPVPAPATVQVMVASLELLLTAWPVTVTRRPASSTPWGSSNEICTTLLPTSEPPPPQADSMATTAAAIVDRKRVFFK